ncbi:IS701 family transposase [Streptomyces sp. NPDC056160]|uniref:IS701 family transposase n=1 Tax=Streptomyces sp. NPDC056160 TaxID=3345731 RepID=UPI0035E3055F
MTGDEMGDGGVCAADGRNRAGGPAPVGACDDVFDDLCSALFASLPRRDQRRRGMEYVGGLLRTEGRKSIRNIAATTGGSATEQRLHHFVTSSTWDWVSVRRDLARYLARVAPPEAWVVHPLVIPKAGEHSVGVERQFVSAMGQVLNAQQAVGVWAASERLCAPVNWRLLLSADWLGNGRRRVRASIPEGLLLERTLGDCSIEACLDTAAEVGLPVRPVVLDARDADGAAVVRRLRAANLPVLARVSGSLPLSVTDAALAPRGGAPVPAHQIMGAAREMRRPARRGADRGAVRTSLVAGLRVALPGEAGAGPSARRTGDAAVAAAGGTDLLLVGEWRGRQRWPAALWLTDLTKAPPAALLRLGSLLRRVDRDFAAISDQVGLRDYAGRSFSGWHRHVTLASAAHAVAALTGAAGAYLDQAS